MRAGLRGIARQRHPIPVLLQDAREQFPDAPVVVDEQKMGCIVGWRQQVLDRGRHGPGTRERRPSRRLLPARRAPQEVHHRVALTRIDHAE